MLKITDTNNKITYEIKVCVINVAPKYLENIQTLYLVNVASNLKRSRIQIYGVTANLIINPGFDEIVNISVESEETLICLRTDPSKISGNGLVFLRYIP